MTTEARNDEPKAPYTHWERVFDDSLSAARIQALRTAGFKMGWTEYADRETPQLIGFRVLEKSDDTCDAIPRAMICVDRTSGLDAEAINSSDATTDVNQGYRLYLLDDDPNPVRWVVQTALLEELLAANP